MTKYHTKKCINLIIGTDAFKNIKTWYHSDELKQLVHFIVFPRNGYIIDPIEFKNWNYEIVPSEMINISSSDIRENINMEKITKIREYIEKNELYT